MSVPRLLFVCLGNICRSPMAACVMSWCAEKRGGVMPVIDSAGISDEEAGNGMYPLAVRELQRRGIPCPPHRARQLTVSDMTSYDWLLCMESRQVRHIGMRFRGVYPARAVRLTDWTSCPRDISDPWYSGDFRGAFEDILDGCTAFLAMLDASRGDGKDG